MQKIFYKLIFQKLVIIKLRINFGRISFLLILILREIWLQSSSRMPQNKKIKSQMNRLIQIIIPKILLNNN